MTDEERRHMIEHLFLLHPQLQQLKDDLDRCAADGARAATDQTHYPSWLAILGPQGVGKTGLLRLWLEEASREEGYVPYLSFSLSATLTWNSSPKMLLASLLNTARSALTLPKPRFETTWTMRDSFVEILHTVPIHLLVLDHCEHLVDRQNQRINYALVDLIVDVARSARVAVALLGRPEETGAVLAANPQLARRIWPPRYLNPFMWDPAHSETMEESCAALRAIDHCLPFNESGLGVQDMSHRILYATDGTLEGIMALVQHAAFSALDAGATVITRPRFAQAYEARIAPTPLGRGKVNPFLPEAFSETAGTGDES
jgi:hypothetical protein